MHNLPRILLTVGEPAGIGPDLILQIAQYAWPAELVVVSDPTLLQSRSERIGLPIKLVPLDIKAPPVKHTPFTLKILPVNLSTSVIPGQLNAKNALFVLACLELAAEYCLENLANALVTGPLHKALINQAGIAFKGHTEFLQDFCNAPAVMMMFVVDTIKVALATTHIPLSEVSSNITAQKLQRDLHLLNNELKKRFRIKRPTILVSGLNPHAGESGLLGREEIDIITPTLHILQSQGVHVIGPLPADTLFTEKNLTQADAFFTMYHDQALPVIKYMGFNRAVNVTLGLPIIRTSVDHGTALDLAGTKNADDGSLQAAIHLAIRLTEEYL